MSLWITIDGVDRTYAVQVADGIGSLLTMADHGEVGAGQILIDDPDGSLTFDGWRSAYVEEDECVTQPRVWSGYVGIRTYARGRDSFRTEDARLITMDIVDLNTAAGLKAWTTADAKRPYESETTRMTALLASECMAGLIYDNGLVDTSGGQSYDEADFRRQYTGEVLASMASSSKNWYIYRDHASGETSLFWDQPDAAVRDSTLTISNVLSDQAAGSLRPYRDAELTRDPSEVYSRFWIEWVGGVTMSSSPATEAAYIDRDGGYTSSRIGREATALAAVETELAIHGIEQDRIAVTVFVPADKLGLIEAGQRISVRFSHLPGYESFTWQRIISCDVLRFDTSEEAYEVRLELSLAKRAGSPGGGGTFPKPTGTLPSIVQSTCATGAGGITMTATLSSAPTAGHVLVAVISTEKFSTAPTITSSETWTEQFYEYRYEAVPDHDCGFGIYTRYVGVGEDATVLQMSTTAQKRVNAHVYEFADATLDGAVATHGNGTVTRGATVAITPGSTAVPSFFLGGHSIGKTNYNLLFGHTALEGTTLFDGNSGCETGTCAVEADVYPPAKWVAYRTGTGVLELSAVVCMQVGYTNTEPRTYGGILLPSASGASPPAPGQWFYGDIPTPTPDGTTTTFTTSFPFAAGSLTVWVDRLNQTAAVVSQDNTTGEFTLGFAPQVGELVECDYQGI